MEQGTNQEKGRPWESQGEQAYRCPLALPLRNGAQSGLAHGEGGKTSVAAVLSPSPGSPSTAEMQASCLRMQLFLVGSMSTAVMVLILIPSLISKGRKVPSASPESPGWPSSSLRGQSRFYLVGREGRVPGCSWEGGGINKNTKSSIS